MKMKNNRSSAKDELIGCFMDFNLNTSKLPTNRDALKRLLSLKNNKIKNPFRLVAKECFSIYVKSGLNIISLITIQKKLERLFKEYRIVKVTPSTKRFELFMDDLDKLIKCYNDNQNKTNKEDIMFLESQKNGVGYMDGAESDNIYFKNKSRILNEKIRNENGSYSKFDFDYTNCTDIFSDQENYFENEIENKNDNKIRICSKNVAAGKLLNVSHETVRRNRKKQREIDNQKVNLQICQFVEAVIYFDTKRINGCEFLVVVAVECLTGNETLLEGLYISDGKGKTIANAVYMIIEKYNLKDKIKGLCYDTTASNTGIYTGSVKYLCDFLKPICIVKIPCRHHIFEIIVAAVFEKCFGKVSRPNILGYDFVDYVKLFYESNPIKYKNEFTVKPINKIESVDNNPIISILESVKKFKRDDYKELIELTIVCLKGGTISLKIPGPVSKARWMARIIYALKAYILGNTHSEQLNLFMIFACYCYTPYWVFCHLSNYIEEKDKEMEERWDCIGNIDEMKDIISCALQKWRKHKVEIDRGKIGICDLVNDPAERAINLFQQAFTKTKCLDEANKIVKNYCIKY